MFYFLGGTIPGIFAESNADCRYDDTRCWSEVIHDIHVHNGVHNLCRTTHHQLSSRHINDDSKFYVYTVPDKRKLNIKKFRSFPFCGSHFNMTVLTSDANWKWMEGE